MILVAELLLVALLVVLAVVFGRLSREPAADRVERVGVPRPVALYTGWVSMATVLGTAATGVGWACRATARSPRSPPCLLLAVAAGSSRGRAMRHRRRRATPPPSCGRWPASR